jgi:hypothetical protein
MHRNFSTLALLASLAAAPAFSQMTMPSAFGPYAMTREGSGTAWQPEATPMDGVMIHGEQWMTMVHGFANVTYDHQGGPRGDAKGFTSSMLMVMGSRPLLGGTLGLRGMFSLDPAMGKGGYPLLFQTGETANGTTGLVDRQHPHDAFMELAASYSRPIGEEGAIFFYGGLPGEPALGPSTFMHRFSGMRNPEAPITHHWLDSTHITMGVATLGASYGAWKVEGSVFNGREPDQNRWNIETGRMDSSSGRVSFNPTPHWSFQASYGSLKQPEQLEPDVDIRRTTASAMYQATLRGMKWGSTLAWGRNDKRGGEERSRKLDGWLLESTLEVSDRHTLFARAERVENDELFGHGDPLHGRVFDVEKLSAGYIYGFARTGPVQWGVGGLASAYRIPGELEPAYGAHPRSYMVFLQARL